MSAPARIEPAAFDRDAAIIACERDPGSRSPDVDSDGVIANTAPRLLQWSRGLPWHARVKASPAVDVPLTAEDVAQRQRPVWQ